MNEEVKVTVANDDGFKRRWGVSSLLYRNEGTKQSINSKVAAGLFGSFMLAGAGYSILSEFFKPTPTQSSGPIAFNEQVNSEERIQIPIGNSEITKSSTEKRINKNVISYSGLQLVQRPNFGKIPAGTMVKAKFVTGASNGPLKAVLVETLYVNGEDIAPEGTTLIGNGNSNEDRLSVQFTKLVFKDGKSQLIQAQACDTSDQMIGVKGKKISKFATMLATSAVLNFLGGVAEGLQENQVQNGVAVKKNDLNNAALNGASKAAIDQSQEILSDIKNKKSIIQVESGKEFLVLFEGE